MAQAPGLQLAERQAQIAALMRDGQARLCAAFEELEAQGAAEAETQQAGRFLSSTWERPGGGGGTSRVLTEGAVFERAGVNVSAVSGEQVPPGIASEHPGTAGNPYFATGISLVLHPRNPYVPAFHANFRYFDVGGDWWFGGGMDMTPTYGFEEDATFFHRVLKDYCDRHSLVYYETLKQACDRYFYIKHRQEMRGVGGIFFDTLQPGGPEGWEQAMAFVQDGIDTILAAYVPLVQRRMTTPYGRRERNWQIYRRGRYVEFNLVYDRGTAFGLQSGGDIEAVLMSMPPVARWDFCYQPEPDSPEAGLVAFLQPRDWVAN
jgi:coproporphyrinogen III oxidase